MAGDLQVGQVTSAANSPDFNTGVAIGMVRMTHWETGTELDVLTPNGPRAATVHDTFWI
jgi:dimethylsulfoniopropionate demethylase